MKWLLVLLALVGCPSFHPAPLPGAPAGATFVDVDGVHVHYREMGAGPAVVLIHGYGASLESWALMMPALAQGHRVIAVDLKGFGWTSRPEGDYSPAAQAQLVWGVLDKLGVGDVAIVGHSWGTSVALAMAVAHPERTRRVALFDAYVYDEQVPSFFRWSQQSGLGELLFGLFYKERIEDRAPLAYYDARWITQARVERVEADLDKPGTTAAALAVARGHHFAELHAQLAHFAKPVLLLWGANDEVTPVAYGYRLANELANAEIKVYEHCGHIPMVEARSRSTRDLTEFLGKDGDHGTSGAGEDHGGGDRGSGDAGSDGNPQSGSGAGGGASGGATAATATTIDDVKPGFGPPPANAATDLPVGADLAALGAELTPRAYAAPREHTELVVHGGLRVRQATLYNLDLDRGLDPTGKPLFPVPLGGGQTLESSDLRARTDIALYAKGVGVAVKARIDWLDNVALGGTPDLAGGSPATSGGQRPTAVVVKRAWGEALTPAGTLAVGRMGAHFGLGIAANGGDCEDCDHGDAADRAAFVSPIAGHLIAIAYDVASSGPFTRSKDGSRPIALEPSDKAAGPTLAILKVHSPAALARRADAGRTTVEYAAYVSHRTQDRDVPASYLPIAAPATYTSNDLVARGFSATTTGGWLRATGQRFRIEAELAYATAEIANPSLVPGAVITESVTSHQLGLAVESDLQMGPARLGFDGGYASGDPAPGFGAFPQPGQTTTVPGQLDGPQANLPRDRTVDNFRFHPDYHIDQILFREIIGTITDAIYVRPHLRTRLMTVGVGHLEAGAALIASWAVEAASTPSGQKALGIELDPELRYASRDGFAATIDYGVLFPGAGFNNTMLEAKPAQVLRARLAFAF
ncbi:MAG: TIGR04551 family protein [Deltaproteobacteria bacterium]|nr:TIGR04551 family protein [Deltaproteobacteria bacterium]